LFFSVDVEYIPFSEAFACLSGGFDLRYVLQPQRLDGLLAQHELPNLATGRQGIGLDKLVGEAFLPWLEEPMGNSIHSEDDVSLHFSAMDW
jgi:hypothetical protein